MLNESDNHNVYSGWNISNFNITDFCKYICEKVELEINNLFLYYEKVL